MLMMLISRWCSPDGVCGLCVLLRVIVFSVDVNLLRNTLSLEGDGSVDVS